MIMKECNSAAWLAEVKKRVENLDKLRKRGEPVNSVSASTLEKLADDTRRSMWQEAHELVAAAQILRDEIAVESGKETK